MEINLEFTDNCQWKENMKTKIYKEINKLVILGIIKKWLSEVYSLAMAIHRKE